jgi:hypothetical protein
MNGVVFDWLTEPPGQFDRLPGHVRHPRVEPVERSHRLVRQAGELQVGPSDPAGQSRTRSRYCV